MWGRRSPAARGGSHSGAANQAGAGVQPAQQLRGEVLGHDPGEDEEAGVVHDQVQPTLALSAVPANERVAGCGFPRCCAETRQGGDAALGTGEAAKLGPGQWLVAEVVVAVRR